MKLGKKAAIGQSVVFDTIYPEDIEIGYKSGIAFRSGIITHFMEPLIDGERAYRRGKVKIGDYVFIGAHTIIAKPVTIGDYAVVAAGSVVTKDIPPCEIWGGVPARFIKKREVDKSLSY